MSATHIATCACSDGQGARRLLRVLPPGKVSTLKHEFSVGQIVELKPNAMRLAAAGQYEILHLMPDSNESSATPRYRIKSREEIYQRIVPESDLTLSTAGRLNKDYIDGSDLSQRQPEL